MRTVLHRRSSTASRAVAALCLAVLTACASAPDAASPTEFFAAEPRSVLEAAEAILAQQGYVFEAGELSYGTLIGQQTEQVTRGRSSLLKGTVVQTQVVIETATRGTGTDVRATFNISVRRPTGERRTWSAETPQAMRLRRQFYSRLHDELDVT